MLPTLHWTTSTFWIILFVWQSTFDNRQLLRAIYVRSNNVALATFINAILLKFQKRFYLFAMFIYSSVWFIYFQFVAQYNRSTQSYENRRCFTTGRPSHICAINLQDASQLSDDMKISKYAICVTIANKQWYRISKTTYLADCESKTTLYKFFNAYYNLQLLLKTLNFVLPKF